MTSAIRSHKPTPPRTDAIWTAFCDGATLRTNPSSEGGWGFAIFADDLLYFAAHGKVCGNVSSLTAEFAAIYHASDWVFKRFGIRQFTLHSDNKTALSLVSGEGVATTFATRKDTARCKHYRNFLDINYVHVNREHPTQAFADFLSNIGIHNEGRYTTKAQHIALLDAYDQWHTHSSPKELTSS